MTSQTVYRFSSSVYNQGKDILQRLKLAFATAEELKAPNISASDKEIAKRVLEELKVDLQNTELLEEETNTFIQHATKLLREVAIISERTEGLDHYLTLKCYLELVPCEVSIANIKVPFELLKYIVRLSEVIYGTYLPEILQLVVSDPPPCES
jgi:hypothetical protein